MPQEVKLPEISENVESGEVVNVLVSKGDHITKEQPLVELETEKAGFEVPSPVEGDVADIAVKKGDTVKVGQVLMTVEEGESAEKAENTETQQPEAHTKDTGKETESETKKGESEEQPKSSSEARKEENHPPRQPSQPVSEEPPPASPAVRREARELGVAITDIRGTGPNGRISLDDVRNHIRDAMAQKPGPGVTEESLPDFSRWGTIRREPMTKVRRLTAEKMKHSWQTIPQVTHFDSVDMTTVEKFRHHHSDDVSRAGGKLTVTAILVKSVAHALQAFPRFNASVAMARADIIMKEYVNIAVAVDTPRGLLVPVVRNVHQKGITRIAAELVELSRKAREKNIKPDEFEGGTFTISNVGGIGGTSFTPIIYPPQVAILGIARARIQPLYDDNTFQPRLMLPCALTFDHRIIDGADAARFMRWIGEALEDPFTMDL